MSLPQYNITADENSHIFYFISIGKKGKIEKVVIYEETDVEGVFNLGFGDKNPITGGLDDLIVTNNGDTEKVLATVVTTLYTFTKNYPFAVIYIEGSSPSRNRLYRLLITKYLDLAEQDFNIYGVLSNEAVVPFIPNSEYIAFIIQRKIKQL